MLSSQLDNSGVKKSYNRPGAKTGATHNRRLDQNEERKMEKEVFIKMVISTHTEKEDLLEAAKLINEINKGAILVLQQDSFGHNQAMENKLRTFKNTCLKEGITTCVIPQMHKAMGLR